MARKADITAVVERCIIGLFWTIRIALWVTAIVVLVIHLA